MPTFEERLFGCRTNEGRRVHFKDSRPDFDIDIRKILEDPNLPRYPEEPEATTGRALFLHLEKYMQSFGLPTEHLKWQSGVGREADLFHEADGVLLAWIGRPVVITFDAFNLSHKTFKMLTDYWLDVFDGSYYTWKRMQYDLFRFKRIFTERRTQLRTAGYPDPEALDAINWWLLSSEFKEMWESGYIVEIPKHFIQRPRIRPENQVIITPSQVRNRSERRFFAKMLAQYILEEAEKPAAST